jgi:septal ring factor EnvC (AmiA/AmiB activator)
MIPGMFKKKKKRAVDPNAPPRPTLLGHEKEMKTWREEFAKLANQNTEQAMTISKLQRKVNRLENQIDSITSYLNRRK